MKVNTRSCRMAKSDSAVDAAESGLCCASVIESPLSRPDAANLAHVLAALADPIRLQLFSIVAAHGEVCSCDLEAPLARSQPTISHHTKLLAEAGLIVGEKRGRWVWWRIEPNRLADVRRALGG
jgi:ArsR family transcriptional regulator, arsenate/arsenite/antimonite-responsive transcriptional repressor